LFGAAVPGQPSGPAQNLQWPSWWAAQFESHGFRPDDWLRPIVWEHPEVDWWYAQNTILYEASDAAGGRVLPLVHPGLLAEVNRPAQEPPAKRRLPRLRAG
jgi:hypothetical protein